MADDVIDRLAKLKPAAPDRDAMLFAAGRASARRGPWRLLLVGLVIQQAVLIWIWTLPKEPENIVYLKAESIGQPSPSDPQSAPAEAPSVSPRGPASLLNLDQQSSEPIPSSSIAPEQHWTVRTTLSDL
jgi:hypothetical protein